LGGAIFTAFSLNFSRGSCCTPRTVAVVAPRTKPFGLVSIALFPRYARSSVIIVSSVIGRALIVVAAVVAVGTAKATSVLLAIIV
jgi:hypothetical protein